jgi:hypothetical protein
MPLDEVEKWLGPWLNYDPGAKAAAPQATVACGCGERH